MNYDVLMFIITLWLGILNSIIIIEKKLVKKIIYPKFFKYIFEMMILTQLTGVVLRGVKINFFPGTNPYEVLMLLVLFILILFGIKKEEKWKNMLSLNLTIIIFTAFSFMPFIYSEGRSAEQTLKTTWLIIHIVLIVAGEALLTAGAIFSIITLISKNSRQRADENKRYIDKFNFFGILFFIVGAIVIGMMWAKIAWGRYWSWDPKEVAALFTVIFYMLYFILNRMNIKNRLKILFSILAYLFMIASFIGTNYILSGLHSYR